MSKKASETLAPQDAADPEGSGTLALPERIAMSRRRAIPLIGLAVVAAGGCNFSESPFEVDPNAEADRLNRLLQAARVHRGGMQRYGLHDLADNVVVRVEEKNSKLLVTVYEVDPETRSFVMDGADPRVLEVHRNMTNATLSQIESDYVLFYYLNEG